MSTKTKAGEKVAAATTVRSIEKSGEIKTSAFSFWDDGECKPGSAGAAHFPNNKKGPVIIHVTNFDLFLTSPSRREGEEITATKQHAKKASPHFVARL